MENLQWQVPDDLYYDSNDYWMRILADEAVIGLTAFGQYNTGDVLYLELPLENTDLVRGEKTGSIESGKWVGKLSVPLSGTILEINHAVQTRPYLINQDAYGEGWLYRIRIESPQEITQLMNADSYRKRIDQEIQREQEITVL